MIGTPQLQRAAAVAASDGCRAWVGVTAIDLELDHLRPEVRAAVLENQESFLEGQGLARPDSGVTLYRVTRFELPLEILAQEETLGHDYDLFMRDVDEQWLYGETALVAWLARWGLTTSDLVAPWRADYPL